MDGQHHKNNKIIRVYKSVYPKTPSPVRLDRLKHQGIPVCPQCGSEAVQKGGVEKVIICIRCGYRFN